MPHLSNLPPGVSGNESEITGDYPCGFCGGFGIDFHGHEVSVTVFHRDGTFKTFDNTDAADAYAGPDDEVIVDEHPTGEACCVPCKGTGREPEDGDSIVYDPRFCPLCEADIDGNDPHGPTCPRGEAEDTRTFAELFRDEYPHGPTQPHPES